MTRQEIKTEGFFFVFLNKSTYKKCALIFPIKSFNSLNFDIVDLLLNLKRGIADFCFQLIFSEIIRNSSLTCNQMSCRS